MHPLLFTLLCVATAAFGQLTSQDLDISQEDSNAFLFDPGFDIRKVTTLAVDLPSHSWEYGTAIQMLLELYDPDLSVFGSKPFPVPILPKNALRAMRYAEATITIGVPPDGLADGDGAVGDPAALGVGAILLGKTEERYRDAVWAELEYLNNSAPRWPNGAISHRADVAELWADFIYMAPPFIAYYGADTEREDILRIAVDQCRFYRDVLQVDISRSVPYRGVWEHIRGPQLPDPGLWSTGNAWAAAGMARVLATVTKYPRAQRCDWCERAKSDLTKWIKEILDGAIGSPADPSNDLLRNYLNETIAPTGFGEISGSSLLAAVAYRMAVLQPSEFGRRYIRWADDIRKTIGGVDAEGNPHITRNGTATPAVNPLGWGDTTPWTAGSPEGNNFVVLMYAAWRDCIFARKCQREGGGRGEDL